MAQTTTSLYVFECTCGRVVKSAVNGAASCVRCHATWSVEWSYEIDKAKAAA